MFDAVNRQPTVNQNIIKQEKRLEPS